MKIFKEKLRIALKMIKHSKKYKNIQDDDILKNIDKWDAEGKCIHCGSEKICSEKYDAYYCPKCLYWTEKICPDRKCFYCKNRPKYPRKNQK